MFPSTPRRAIVTPSPPTMRSRIRSSVTCSEDWAANRVFPNTPIRGGESVTFDGVRTTVVDLGPSESPHDSPWILGTDERIVFLGDQIYDHRHCFLDDGFYEWLANIEMLRSRFPSDAVFYMVTADLSGEMWDSSAATSRHSSPPSAKRTGRNRSRRRRPSSLG